MKRGLKNQYVAWMALVATLGLVDVAHALRMMSPASVIAQNARQGTKLCIAAGNGQYMAVEPADTRRVNANRRTCGPAETFRLIEVEADIYAVFNPTRGTYLSCQPDGRLEGNRTNLGPWEKFAIAGKIKAT